MINSENPLLARLIAGLGADKTYVKSCSLEAISLIYKNFKRKIDSSLSQNFLELSLLILKEKNKEVFVSVLKVVKNYLRIQKKSILKE